MKTIPIHRRSAQNPIQMNTPGKVRSLRRTIRTAALPLVGALLLVSVFSKWLIQHEPSGTTGRHLIGAQRARNSLPVKEAADFSPGIKLAIGEYTVVLPKGASIVPKYTKPPVYTVQFRNGEIWIFPGWLQTRRDGHFILDRSLTADAKTDIVGSGHTRSGLFAEVRRVTIPGSPAFYADGAVYRPVTWKRSQQSAILMGADGYQPCTSLLSWIAQHVSATTVRK